ncbi:SpoVT/AbrB domain-containing protein [Desulfofundulus kuznetsovii DSM 6115]|uniref:SpoVT/AbrB domain-containing protein n=1 Tax=Desulfofundulus kuznetsovii (strain DSM 6115 / VKM B-1805 / 17) TaxID=760568 RepID=A0AAU8Q0W5_DESK7|nr:SpoVT/AbrB domain-containing protein [Desulfofundulus kuznetsovii DSM 6115]
MNLIRIRSKGQITLPLPVRRAVQADIGDYLVCEVRGDSVILRKAPVYPRASFDDAIWRLVGSAEDKEGREDVSVDKHKYLGDEL